MVAAAAVGAGVAAMSGKTSVTQAQAGARTFVLVHGAWHGGWCWRRVADLLAKRGHKVFAPTLTGLGERSHLISGSVNLDTHITDVVNVIKWENLTDICLVAHSYGGWPVSGAIEQVPDRIASVVYLDAFMPEDGQGGLAVASKAETFSVNDKDRAWVDSKLTAQPVGVALQPIKLTGAREKIAKKTYIRSPSYPQPAFDKALAAKKIDPSWRTYEVPSGHDVMVDMPERLVEILLEVA